MAKRSLDVLSNDVSNWFFNFQEYAPAKHYMMRTPLPQNYVSTVEYAK